MLPPLGWYVFPSAPSRIMVSMNRLSTEKRAQVIGCLVEGMSIRATVRATGAAKNTVSKLLLDLGVACSDQANTLLVHLPCKRVQCDEIWSFCYAKQKNVPEDHKGEFGYGDVWTWVAIDADTKLVPSWMVGDRSTATAIEFIRDVSFRMANRVQLTTDGHGSYIEAVEQGFRGDIDFAQLIKIYGQPEGADNERRYSPAVCTGTKIHVQAGNPDIEHINTSYVERQNLTMRMSMRRFTRLTNGFSKKIENHVATVAIHAMYYNFVRIHQTLRVTPAMAAGLTSRLWDVEDLVGLLD